MQRRRLFLFGGAREQMRQFHVVEKPDDVLLGHFIARHCNTPLEWNAALRRRADDKKQFLSAAPKSAVKIGVAYSFQIVADLPSEPHDVPLTGVVDDSINMEAK